MSNELLSKLIKKVNFDYAQKFDIERTKELSFVPVNIQSDAFFVGICQKSDKEKIKEYVNSVLGMKADFIYLKAENFTDFWSAFSQEYYKRFPSKSANDIKDTASKKPAEPQVITVEKKTSKPAEISRTVRQGPKKAEEKVTIGAVSGGQTQAKTQNPSPEQSIALEERVENLLIDDDKIDLLGGAEGVFITPLEGPPVLLNENGEDEIVFENADDAAENKTPVQEQSSTLMHKKTVLTNPVHTGGEPRRIDMVKNPNKKRLGEIFVEEGLITQKQLTIALAEAKASDIPLGSILVKLGFIKITDLKEALSAQQGVELASTEQLKPIPGTIKILPEDFVKLNKVIPLSASNKSLVVGMVNPGDTVTINEIVYLTGFKPTVLMITHFEFENFVQQFYQSTVRETEKILNEINKESGANTDGNLWEQVDKEIQDTTGMVSKFANKIITMGIDQKVSDIHIEPRFDGYIVRYRKDGILKEVLQIPLVVDSAVITRFKVLARMNIAEHRRPQDGNFAIKYKGNSYDFRINTLPVAGKEKMVIRILAPAASLTAEKAEIKIDGMSPEQLERVKAMSCMPNGIILTSGPTGSGKTTTLYSLIKALNDEKVNITTIEDPIEIRLEGINQSATNIKAGITFASCMRAILRQDPDIILVGEIRDSETLEVAISAALTGHLVLSTVHTNSAAATVTRLVEMGAKDFMVASTLTGVLAQRLVRRLCPDCKEAYKPSLDEAKKVLLDPKEIEEFTKTTIYRAKGCQNCEDKGYKGRLGVYEVMTINKEIRKMIVQKISEVAIEEYAISQGMVPLQGSCLNHIRNGLTTVEEFIRVLGLATD